MIKVNVFEVKAKLSEYLDRAEAGERIVICRRNRPVAELRAVAAVRTEPRPVGGFEGQIAIPATFFDPLPADVLESFDSPPIFPSGVQAAESRATSAPTARAGKARGSRSRRRP